MAGGAGVGLVVACSTPDPFACVLDADCTLAGTPGICVSSGNCAYPDDACTSGFSYPAVTPNVGGTCVPVDGGTASESDGADDDDGNNPRPTSGGAGSGSDAVDDDTSTTANTSAMTAGGGVSTSGPLDDTATSEDSSGPAPACVDEVGDSVITAEPLAGCEVEGGSAIDDATDDDWWALFGPGAECASGNFGVDLSWTSTEPLSICVLAGCEGDRESVAVCDDTSDPVSLFGYQGCCGPQTVFANLDCQGASGVDPFVLVTAASGADPVCAEYSFVVEYLGT